MNIRTELDLVAINYIDDYCKKAEHVFKENAVVHMKYGFFNLDNIMSRNFPFTTHNHRIFLPNGYLDVKTRISDHVNHFMQLRKLKTPKRHNGLNQENRTKTYAQDVKYFCGYMLFLQLCCFSF